MNYYNEFDPYAAEWLRGLIRAGRIPFGVVDTRSIEDVRPDELAPYTQCHFFAGIAGWSLALELAGVDPTTPLWTGSCPCQPFSAAGAGAGFADERHLWPAFEWLISQCRPAIVLGEQVASKAVDPWLDLVRDDLEALGYAFGATAFPSASVGAPHIRDRTYWVGYADNAGPQGHAGNGGATGRQGPRGSAAAAGVSVRLADTTSQRRFGRRSSETSVEPATIERSERLRDAGAERTSPTNGFWRDADWLACRDDKWRPVEPSAQQVVDGLSAGVGCLRANRKEAEVLINASVTEALAAEALRQMREGYGAETIWLSLGRRIGFPQATVLFAAMCQHSRELGAIVHSEAARGAQVGQAELRALRQGRETSRAPQRREFPEQLLEQSRDLVSELSQASPRFGAAVIALSGHSGGPLAHKVASRVGRLRAYGNAINPHQAAEFIRAALPYHQE